MVDARGEDEPLASMDQNWLVPQVPVVLPKPAVVLSESQYNVVAGTKVAAMVWFVDTLLNV